MADSGISILETTAADGKIYKTKYYNPDIHHRRSIRLKGYDYSQAGAYFITISAQNRKCLFGKVVNGEMVCSDLGRIASESWLWMGNRYDHIILDAWVIMPNHLHGILVIADGRGGSRTAPTDNRKPLGRLIGAFKTVSTKRVNKMRRTPEVKLWQRNYYEHIVRNENELNRIREYIVNNPMQWELDRENPDVVAVREPPLHREPPLPYGDEPWRI